MARRWILTAAVTVVLVVVAVIAARAIRDDDDDTSAARPTTTSSASSTTSTTSTTTATATSAPATTAPGPTTTATAAPATTDGPPGPCGTDTGPIRAAIDAAVTGAAANAQVDSCRLAASDPSWAAVALTARPGAQFDALTVIVHGGAGSWSVVAQGGPGAGCGQAPQQVIVDLGQFCAGTGGGAGR
jgi:hypothetical protein